MEEEREMVFFAGGEQDVAFEVEIGEDDVNKWTREEYEYQEERPESPSTIEDNQYLDYVPVDGDRWVDEDGVEFEFESTSQVYRPILPECSEKLEAHVDVVDEKEADQKAPVLVNETTRPQNVYLMKRGGKRKYPEKEMKVRDGQIQQLMFSTSFSGQGSKNSQKLLRGRDIKVAEAENVEEIIENGQIIKKLNQEIELLKKNNEKLKKSYETVFKRLDGLKIVLQDAKQRSRDANLVKKELVMQLTKLRQEKKKLSGNSSLPSPTYRRPPTANS